MTTSLPVARRTAPLRSGRYRKADCWGTWKSQLLSSWHIRDVLALSSGILLYTISFSVEVCTLGSITVWMLDLRSRSRGFNSWFGRYHVVTTWMCVVLLRLSKPVPKPRFYASVLTVRFWNGAALVSWTLTVAAIVSPTRIAGGCYRWDQRWDRRGRRPCTPRVCVISVSLMSLNDAVFVAWTLVMQTWKWHAV